MRNEKLYAVYMMASRSRTLYVGFTGDLFARVLQHREGMFAGFSADYQCTRLVWFERFVYPEEAIAREKQIKRWRREKKDFLIERENPTWEDLAADWGRPVELYPPSGEKAGSSTARDEKTVPLRSE